MDTFIINGDICVESFGDYRFVKGIDEVLQKAVFAAKIRKGSFLYHKALGTEIAGIDINSPKALKNASLLLQEAIIDNRGYTAEVEKISKTPDGGISLLISVSNSTETRKQEVTLSTDL